MQLTETYVEMSEFLLHYLQVNYTYISRGLVNARIMITTLVYLAG